MGTLNSSGGTVRSAGLDLLRAAAMAAILINHIITQGGVMYEAAAQINYAAYSLCYLLQSFTLWGSSVFALITGYFSVRTGFRPAGYLRVWLQTLFWSLLITVIFAIAAPDQVLAVNWYTAIFPITHRAYWYITCYTALFLMIPLLNAAVNALDKRLLTLLLAGALVLLCALPPLGNVDTFSLNNGYSPWWLALMYLCGAYLRTYGDALVSRVRTRTLVLILLVCGFFTWGVKMAEILSAVLLNAPALTDYLAARAAALECRCSLPLAAVSLCVFLLFQRLKLSERGRRISRFLAAHALGVYLIHVQPLLFRAAYYLFAPLVSLPVWLLLPAVAALAFSLFCICILLDWLRSLLFRLLRIDALAGRLGDFLTDRFRRLADRLPE